VSGQRSEVRSQKEEHHEDPWCGDTAVGYMNAAYDTRLKLLAVMHAMFEDAQKENA